MKSGKIGWNWCGFLFGMNWMIYRKMYAYAAAFFFAPIILDIIILLVAPTEMFYFTTSAICNLALVIFAGMYSDYWYKLKIDKLVKEGINLTGEEKEKHLKKGGTSFALRAVLIIISFIIEMIP